MSKGVQKYCSILNYIRQADEDLFELVQDLCVVICLSQEKTHPALHFLDRLSCCWERLKS